ncbi:MAG: asparaginase [Chloroflexi bacterium]|nr:asparaginase [Chloroflexota bacterium]
MTRVALITTGGTIAMRHDAAQGGAVPQLGVRELLSGLSGLPEVEAHEFCNLPSAHLTLDHLWGIRRLARDLIQQDETAGVVITHGTDTLEETAYLLDLTVDSPKPIVLTGAMRTASEVGYDGSANLAAALRVAAAPQARELGALVVLNDAIHAARWVTKAHTTSLDTFQSPGWGPLGRVNGDAVEIGYRVQRDIIPTERLEPHVGLLRLAVGQDESLLRVMRQSGTWGVVLEALGGGRVPPWWMPTIVEAIQQGLWIVVASRCPSGTVHDRYGYVGAHRDLVAAGALFSNGLSGAKARLRLMAALGASPDAARVRGWFPLPSPAG